MILSESAFIHNIIRLLREQNMRNFPGILAALLPLFLVGCFETSQVFTINPDGSGKVLLETRFQILSQHDEKPDNTQLKKEVLETLEKSDGVEAWKDLSYRIEPDGRIYFKGTAYFKNINALELDKGSTVRWSRDGNEMVLEVALRKEEEEAPEHVNLTKDQIGQRIQAEREQWKHSKPLMESMMNTLKMDAVFQVCGQVGSVNNLKKTGDTSVSFHLEGAKMVQAIDSLISNDAWMEQRARAGFLERPEDGPPVGADMNELTFGQKGGITARVTGELKPLFDYNAESQAAKSEYSQILDVLKK